GTVAKVREGLAQGGTQYRTLREVTEVLKKKAEAASGGQAKRWHLKLGIALFFLGHLGEATQHLRPAQGALAYFFLGPALADPRKAFDKAGKAGYTASQVQLQRAGIFREKGQIAEARALLGKLADQGSHNAEYHFQLASCALADSDRGTAIRSLERAVELDPG